MNTTTLQHPDPSVVYVVPSGGIGPVTFLVVLVVLVGVTLFFNRI